MVDAFDQAMGRWNKLRAQLKAAKAAKSHVDVVRICDEVLVFSAGHPIVGVVDWMFDKEAAKALAELGLLPSAIARIERAMTGCSRQRGGADSFRTLEGLRDRWRKKMSPDAGRGR